MSVWDDLQGQQTVVAQLRKAALEEIPVHAWLFTGPPGSGRSNAAKAFAATLICEQVDPAERGCGSCHACHTVLAGTHSDVTFVETEKTTISIDEARELVTKAQDRPASARWRIIIIGDADRMAERTTNVLLKAIEEPPPRTLWILCTPSPADVLVTIRSRCRLVTLRVPPVQDVAELLVSRDGIEPTLALACARAAQSHVGIARRLAQDEGARGRREATVRLPLGLRGVSEAVRAAGSLVELATAEAASSNEQRDAVDKEALLRSLGAPETGTLPPSMRAQVRQLEEDQKRRSKRSITDTLDRALTDLLSFYRDVMLIQISSNQAADHELVNAGMRSELADFASRSSAEVSLARIESISEVRRRIVGSNVAPLLAIEAMTVSLL
ncbi:DNA polymerase III, delta' subunit [Renibacterium salmoninarum ATCC 33209]|uniref:DNA polymerase III, delta' subunit n=1 Tax=Renibacterium salmoninarum (strain ATCC 33209 / DSM 20767 / JCM 11484 / NBRC 15589 / NCIMB 2235) TaxID=288705 RepID=A9WLX0_RENSM|nr:DNA polymerase III subunit delta' [Renibacterium salmoninarum]ABY22151.1 DNA polymerase III, delta' subunit [Renibacterium salmoninarum ATCC 33209]